MEEFSLTALRNEVQRERERGPEAEEADRKARLAQICEAAFRLPSRPGRTFTALDLVGILGDVGSVGTDRDWAEGVRRHVVDEYEDGLDQ